MATVIFEGSVTKQASEGETVTITVTKPDSTEEELTATTLADKSFSVQHDYLPGDYSAVAYVAADAQYKEAISQPFNFTIALEDRSITLNVTIT